MMQYFYTNKRISIKDNNVLIDLNCASIVSAALMKSFNSFLSIQAGDSVCHAEALTSKLPLLDLFFFATLTDRKHRVTSGAQVSTGKVPGEKKGKLSIKHHNTFGDNYITLCIQFCNNESFGAFQI